MAALVREDYVVTGPFFHQERAHNLLIRPTNASATSQPVKLGDIAANAGSNPVSTNGIPTAGQYLSLTQAKSATGVPLTATATGGAFGVSNTLGTQIRLLSEVANSSTVSDTAVWEASLPPSLVNGQGVTITTDAQITLGSGTLTTETIVVSAYLMTAAGQASGNLVASGGTITLAGTVAATYDTVLTGTSLVANGRLVISEVMRLVESSGNAVTGQINSVRIH